MKSDTEKKSVMVDLKSGVVQFTTVRELKKNRGINLNALYDAAAVGALFNRSSRWLGDMCAAGELKAGLFVSGVELFRWVCGYRISDNELKRLGWNNER